MQRRWSLLLGAGMLMVISHASPAADASVAPPAAPSAANPAEMNHPAPASAPGNAKSRPSNLSEAQRDCASRMYGSLPRGRSAPN